MGLFDLFGCKKKSAHVYEGRLIKSVRYSYGGGMSGGDDTVELARQDDGSVLLTTRKKMWHNSRATGFDYVLDESVFDRFAEIANEYDLLNASTRKYSDLIALDAATGHLSYSVLTEEGKYDGDASFSISSEQELSKKESDGYRAVREALYSLAEEGEGTEYTEPISLTVTVDAVQHQFVLNDSACAESFAENCPSNATLEAFGDNGLAFELEEPLASHDGPEATGEKGTVCYDSSANDIVILLEDIEDVEGLIEIGRTKDSFEVNYLEDIESGSDAYIYTNYFDE